jgi:hypothetical protein
MVSLPGRGPIYFIVDALDECLDNSGVKSPREEVLDLVEKLVTLRLPNLHICVTSRPESDMRSTLEPLAPELCVDLDDQSGQKKDIEDYIRHFVQSDRKMRNWHKELRKLVIETLCERADGM